MFLPYIYIDYNIHVIQAQTKKICKLEGIPHESNSKGFYSNRLEHIGIGNPIRLLDNIVLAYSYMIHNIFIRLTPQLADLN